MYQSSLRTVARDSAPTKVSISSQFWDVNKEQRNTEMALVIWNSSQSSLLVLHMVGLKLTGHSDSELIHSSCSPIKIYQEHSKSATNEGLIYE